MLREALKQAGVEESSRVLQMATPQWVPPHLLPPPDPSAGAAPCCRLPLCELWCKACCSVSPEESRLSYVQWSSPTCLDPRHQVDAWTFQRASKRRFRHSMCVLFALSTAIAAVSVSVGAGARRMREGPPLAAGEGVDAPAAAAADGKRTRADAAVDDGGAGMEQSSRKAAKHGRAAAAAATDSTGGAEAGKRPRRGGGRAPLPELRAWAAPATAAAMVEEVVAWVGARACGPAACTTRRQYAALYLHSGRNTKPHSSVVPRDITFCCSCPRRSAVRRVCACCAAGRGFHGRAAFNVEHAWPCVRWRKRECPCCLLRIQRLTAVDTARSAEYMPPAQHAWATCVGQAAHGHRYASRTRAVGVGSGVRAQPPDAAAVVIFLAIPGAGKGALCAALADMLPAEHYAVQHIESDAQAGRRSTFWPAVAAQAVTHRGDGRATVVLADKNAIDSPPGVCPPRLNSAVKLHSGVQEEPL